jgi:hypothetical protein
MIKCPNHGGSYDCTPFCSICEGNQEYKEIKVELKRIDRSEEATGDICVYCNQDTVPVGFWSTEGEWVGPFADDPVCRECYKHFFGKFGIDYVGEEMTIYILRKRLEQK